jgi:hypothetical protein
VLNDRSKRAREAGLTDQLAENPGLADGARLEEVRDAAQELSEADLSVLQDFVPCRFLMPWLRSALVGVSSKWLTFLANTHWSVAK